MDTDSVTICPFTTDSTGVPLFRLEVQPTPSNGLQAASRLTVDKLTTLSRAKLRTQIGAPDHLDLSRLTRQVVMLLGVASTLRP